MSTAEMSAADFLVELGVEELPPKSLEALRSAFHESIKIQLEKLDLSFTSVNSYASPRRLAVHVKTLQSAQPDKDIQALGPAVKAAFDTDGNPTPAALGFAKKQGVSVEELTQVDSDKGPRLAFSKLERGQRAVDCLEAVVTHALEQLPIAKRMRWGSGRAEFVRPVHWLVMLYGNDVVPATVLGLTASNTTRGHRFHADKPLGINTPDDYLHVLEHTGHVIADSEKRKALIVAQVSTCAQSLGVQNAKAIIDPDLLDEVTALVEWPVALAGRFDEAFLDVPREALISSMSEHQKYFHVLDGNGDLLPVFITVANLESNDPSKIIDGNERVIRPRLADAAFFYEKDLQTPFANYRERLKPVLFQKQLGTVFSKTERIALLAEKIAPYVGADASIAQRAGQLCKSDLVSEMVLEFPALQGVMGSYYAQKSQEDEAVSTAMREHYLPKHATDTLPSAPVSTAVALADRLDTLTGIFGIKQIPTGSKDPFGLRRAALALIRIIIEGQHSLPLREFLTLAHNQHSSLAVPSTENVDALLEFILVRLSAWSANKGRSAESFKAVSTLPLDDLLDIDHRTEAVNAFATNSSAAPALAAANKRVSNILAKNPSSAAQVQPDKFVANAERELFAALNNVETDATQLIQEKNYPSALKTLALLREPVDAFFDQVMVMDEDDVLRNNRLALLHKLRQLFLSIADISVLPGES